MAELKLYQSAMKKLLPKGLAWQGLTLNRLIDDAMAVEFYRIAKRVGELCNDELPDHADEMLPEWSRIAGSNETRGEMIGKLAAIGGQSIPYYYDLISRISKSKVLIEGFFPYRIGMGIGTPIYGDSWAFSWQISGINPEDLQTIMNVVTRVKQAHTSVLFKVKES